MYFKIKTYQTVKLKQYLKNNTIFLSFNAANFNKAQWFLIQQTLKNLELNFYKPLNKTTIKVFKKCILKNFNFSITGLNVYIDFKHVLNLILIKKAFNFSFTLICLKLNNRIYPSSQLNGLVDLSYKKIMFKLYKLFDKKLKIIVIIINKKPRNNVT